MGKKPEDYFPLLLQAGHISLFSLPDSSVEAELNLGLVLSEICSVDQVVYFTWERF